jgi:NAD(P)-dependent dehydrogenase (short-subunit alcohol dehydrogenase family)
MSLDLNGRVALVTGAGRGIGLATAEALHARGASVPEIRAVTGRSASLIAEYVGLYERARREFPAAPGLADLLGAGAKKGDPR